MQMTTTQSPRLLTDHIVNPANDRLTIAVLDEPGSGGANHDYVVTDYDPKTNPSNVQYSDSQPHTRILFQNGPIAEVGVNGVTHEALLAILCDRLRAFQKGPYASRENAIALTHLEDAQNWLNRRTQERMRRNVEGTHKV